MAVYIRVDKEIIDAIEQGGSDLTQLLAYIPAAQHIFMEFSLDEIDSVLEKIFGEREPYSLITYEGNMLATPDGEAFIPDLLTFKDEGTTYVIAEPATYKLPEEVATAYTLLGKVDYKLFKKKAKLSKDILEYVWQDFECIRDLFAEAVKQEQYIVMMM